MHRGLDFGFFSALRVNTLTGDVSSTASRIDVGRGMSPPQGIVVHPSGILTYATVPDYRFEPEGTAFAPAVVGAALDTIMGSLSLRSVVELDAAASSLALDPTGRFVYAVAPDANAAFGYIVDHDTGELTSMARSPFAVGDAPHAIVIIGTDGG
jgi:hypothetical protein